MLSKGIALQSHLFIDIFTFTENYCDLQEKEFVVTALALHKQPWLNIQHYKVSHEP